MYMKRTQAALVDAIVNASTLVSEYNREAIRYNQTVAGAHADLETAATKLQDGLAALARIGGVRGIADEMQSALDSAVASRESWAVTEHEDSDPRGRFLSPIKEVAFTEAGEQYSILTELVENGADDLENYEVALPEAPAADTIVMGYATSHLEDAARMAGGDEKGLEVMLRPLFHG